MGEGATWQQVVILSLLTAGAAIWLAYSLRSYGRQVLWGDPE